MIEVFSSIDNLKWIENKKKFFLKTLTKPVSAYFNMEEIFASLFPPFPLFFLPLLLIQACLDDSISS